MKLTQDNYFGREAAHKFMSVSQFKAFQRCEAAGLAEVQGLYERPETTALLVGSYVDAKIEGEEAFEKFVSEHPEMFKKDGSLKADLVQAEQIYERIKSDRLAFMLLSGAHQVIITGKIAGVPFRGKIDSLLSPEQCEEIISEFPDTKEALGGPFGSVGAIVDGKVMKDFAPVWSESAFCKQNWVDAWDYPIQGAVYRHLEGGNKPFILDAATKETGTGLDAVYVPSAELDAAFRIVEEYAPRYHKIKLGKIEPTRCENCEWCRRTKRLTRIRNYKEV